MFIGLMYTSVREMARSYPENSAYCPREKPQILLFDNFEQKQGLTYNIQ